MRSAPLLILICVLTWLAPVSAGVGDPQIRTDHPWYPGELSCSTFERLFATQAALYERVTGLKLVSDQDRALAAWLWRNTHYWHGEEGAEDLWGLGFRKGLDMRSREYWTGLFAHGFGLCGTTHSQWVAEMEALLGHGRGRGVGVDGHNTFEALLEGGPYGKGKWVLLDHDQSTVIFDKEGKRLLAMAEIHKDWKRLTSRDFLPERQPWLVCGLHPGDAEAYRRYEVAEYLAGYSGPPPLMHLRRGETLRRYLHPGLADGKTFVFWGRNYNTGGIPGPERSHTWVNQPDKMYGSHAGAGYHAGQARFANAVFTYRPDFNGAYKEGVVEESDRHVVFEFRAPFLIAATPPNAKPWGIYDAGCKNGLVLHGKGRCSVAVSIDDGKTWKDAGAFRDGLDLTDIVKGRRQYLLKFGAAASELIDTGLTMTTVCQVNSSVAPRLKDNATKLTFEASGHAVVSAGPNLDHARTHLVAGKFGSPQVTLELKTPRKEPALTLYAAAHVLSSSPPRPEIRYQIEYSLDGGKRWRPVVKDWSIPRRGDEPADFWSQSMCWGSTPLKEEPTGPVQVRFRNDGGKVYARAEAHLVYRAQSDDRTKVTFAYTDTTGPHEASHVFGSTGTAEITTKRGTQTRWLEFEIVK
ncbi:MAG: hypothetical protein U0793_19300 [Gemmataceae bacterium]